MLIAAAIVSAFAGGWLAFGLGVALLILAALLLALGLLVSIAEPDVVEETPEQTAANVAQAMEMAALERVPVDVHVEMKDRMIQHLSNGVQ